jgi:peptidoglycan/LPS O-acetylase OafA/YrhL
MNPTRLPSRNLDVLRAVAVLSVVVAHFGGQFGRTVGPFTLWQIGRLGVLLFFVHTALVLMSSIERNEGDSHWVRTFYIRRAFRIYPLAIVAILGYQAFHIPPRVEPGAEFTELSARALLQNVALVQNLFDTPLPVGVLWSLPIEVQMYLALPLCYLVARRSVWGVMILGVASAMCWAIGVGHRGFWRLSVIDFAPCFLAGVLAFAVLRKPRPMLSPWAWPVMLLAAICLAGLLDHDATNPSMNWVLCLFVGVSIPFVRDLPSSWFTRAAQRVCEYSYGIYLVHVAALYVGFVVLDLPTVGRCAVFIVVTAGLAYVLYHVVEKPSMAFGRFLTRGRPTTPAVTSPAP